MRINEAGPSGSYLLEELDGVSIVIVGEVHDALVGRLEILPEPPQRHVSLLHPARLLPVRVVPAELVVRRGRRGQVRVDQAAGLQEVADQAGLGRRVLHDDPVEVAHVEERLRQPGELGLLHGPGEGGRDRVNHGPIIAGAAVEILDEEAVRLQPPHHAVRQSLHVAQIHYHRLQLGP